MRIGYKLATEAFGPNEIIRQARRAEDAGFDFVEMSDHFHPWLDNQGHSGFTWSLLGALASATHDVGLVTGVTCPSFRYHPAIIAQAAATMGIISNDRFTLGVGSGERLNEHITGREFPSADRRQEVLKEALEIIRLLWSGGYQSYEGKYLSLDDARIFDLPDKLPLIAVAAGGPSAAQIAAQLGDGLFGIDPQTELVSAYAAAGGSGPRYGEVALAWGPDEDTAAQAALETTRWALSGWKVMSELPNPVNFEAASATVRLEDIKDQFSCGPDVERHVQNVDKFVQAGYDHIVLMNAGPDPDGFIDFYQKELAAALQEMQTS